MTAWRRLRQRLQRCERGAVMAEFALVAPVMLLLLLGSMEVVNVVEAQRRVAHAASTVADLVAQEREIDRRGLEQTFTAADLVMAPLPAQTLGVRVSSFTADSSGQVRRDWMDEGRPYAGDAPAALPAGYQLPRGQGIIVADVSYAYQPVLRWVLPSSLRLQKRMLLRPRTSEVVTRLKDR